MMKKYLLYISITFLGLGLLFSGCTPQRTVQKKDTLAPPVIPAEGLEEGKKRTALFSSAEKAFARGSFDKAKELYARYAETYKIGNLTDDAYFRLGEISLKEGETDAAVSYFGKVVSEYVGSDLFDEAKYRLALAQFKKGDFADVIELLKSMEESPLQKDRRIAIAATIADAYLNMGDRLEAVARYVNALDLEPEKDVKLKILKRLEEVLENKLSEDELTAVSRIHSYGVVAEYAEYYLIGRQVDAGQYDDAKMAAGELLQRLVDAELKLKTSDMLQIIVQRMDVNSDTIGCILPLSGRFAPYGKKVLQGVQLAAGVFGSADGTPIKLVIRDSKGSADDVRLAVEELVEKEKVVAIIGPLISEVAEAAAEAAQEKEVPMVALSKKSGLPDVGNYVFRNFLTNRQQTATLARYAINELGLKKFAILYPKDAYGDELMNLFWSEVTLLGGEIVGIEGYGEGQYDFGKEIKHLVGMDKANKKAEEKKAEHERLRPVIDFDAVFIPDSYEKAALIAPQLVYNDVENVRLLGTNSWHSNKLVEIGEGYVRDAVFTAGFYADSTRESTLAFASEFEAAFGSQPGTLEAMAYDATTMVVKLIKEGHSPSRVEMRDNLYSYEDYDGVTGWTSVTPSGDMDKELFVLTVKKDKIVEVERLAPEAADEAIVEDAEMTLLE
ncbi:MAG: penicillin-binding protein activator [Proteobacteria bacterium]|nr:penicillin-binding protein activator [Pseudomonadota bacterium]